MAVHSSKPAGVILNLNTGDVTSYGVEVEGIWAPTEMFQLTGGLSLAANIQLVLSNARLAAAVAVAYAAL